MEEPEYPEKTTDIDKLYHSVVRVHLAQTTNSNVVIVMVFNVTFNILIIPWRSVLLVEETGIPAENHRPAASHWQTLSHNVVSSTPRLSGIRTHNVSGDSN